MLIGEYQHSIDNKGRLILPSKFRDKMDNKFIITRGIEKCLYIYSLEEWDNIIKKLNSLSFTKRDVRSFIRFFISSASEIEIDKQGRINISSSLIKYANLNKECIIIGALDKIEVWSLEDYNNFMDENIEKVSDIAENLFQNREE